MLLWIWIAISIIKEWIRKTKIFTKIGDAAFCWMSHQHILQTLGFGVHVQNCPIFWQFLWFFSIFKFWRGYKNDVYLFLFIFLNFRTKERETFLSVTVFFSLKYKVIPKYYCRNLTWAHYWLLVTLLVKNHKFSYLYK